MDRVHPVLNSRRFLEKIHVDIDELMSRNRIGLVQEFAYSQKDRAETVMVCDDDYETKSGASMMLQGTRPVSFATDRNFSWKIVLHEDLKRNVSCKFPAVIPCINSALDGQKLERLSHHRAVFGSLEDV